MLVEKCGMNNVTLKDKIIDILKFIGKDRELYPIQLSMNLFLWGLLSKNKRTQAEIIPMIDFMVQTHTLSILKDTSLKEIIKLVDSSDQGIRNNALNVCVTAYQEKKEEFWKLLNLKDM